MESFFCGARSSLEEFSETIGSLSKTAGIGAMMRLYHVFTALCLVVQVTCNNDASAEHNASGDEFIERDQPIAEDGAWQLPSFESPDTAGDRNAAAMLRKLLNQRVRSHQIESLRDLIGPTKSRRRLVRAEQRKTRRLWTPHVLCGDRGTVVKKIHGFGYCNDGFDARHPPAWRKSSFVYRTEDAQRCGLGCSLLQWCALRFYDRLDGMERARGMLRVARKSVTMIQIAILLQSVLRLRALVTILWIAP